LHMLPADPYHTAIAWAERNPPTAGTVSDDWLRRLDDSAEARETARLQQQELLRGCSPDAGPEQFPDPDDRGVSPAVRLYMAASRNAATAVASAAEAIGQVVLATRQVFTPANEGMLRQIALTVSQGQRLSAEAGGYAGLALDLSQRGDRVAEAPARGTVGVRRSMVADEVVRVQDAAARTLTRLEEQKRKSEKAALAALLREQLGNPFRPYPLEPAWRTETVLALAAGIEAERAFDRMPILADALEDAGCDDRDILDHLRGPGPHAVGCWVLDLILDREPELFALPPLVPTPRRMKLGPYTPPPEGMA